MSVSGNSSLHGDAQASNLCTCVVCSIWVLNRISLLRPIVSDNSADVTFKSSDGVLFKLFKTHLDTASAGFNAPDMTTVDDKAILLEESSSVLEILFQFIQPCLEVRQYRQPSVVNLETEIFFAVAEAAEKYIVYGAMNTFFTRMHLLVLTFHCVLFPP